MKRKGEDEKFFLCPSKSIVEPRYLKHSAILVAEKKKKGKKKVKNKMPVFSTMVQKVRNL